MPVFRRRLVFSIVTTIGLLAGRRTWSGSGAPAVRAAPSALAQQQPPRPAGAAVTPSTAVGTNAGAARADTASTAAPSNGRARTAPVPAALTRWLSHCRSAFNSAEWTRNELEYYPDALPASLRQFRGADERMHDRYVVRVHDSAGATRGYLIAGQQLGLDDDEHQCSLLVYYNARDVQPFYTGPIARDDGGSVSDVRALYILDWGPFLGHASLFVTDPAGGVLSAYMLPGPPAHAPPTTIQLFPAGRSPIVYTDTQGAARAWILGFDRANQIHDQFQANLGAFRLVPCAQLSPAERTGTETDPAARCVRATRHFEVGAVSASPRLSVVGRGAGRNANLVWDAARSAFMPGPASADAGSAAPH